MTITPQFFTHVQGSYEVHFIAERIGLPFVTPWTLDNPPAVGSKLVTLPKAISLMGKALDGEGWEDWERTTLHYPTPVLAPSENFLGFLQDLEREKPKPPPPISITSQRSTTRRLDDYAERKRVWDDAAPERTKIAQASLERVQERFREWREGAEVHRKGVEALRRVFLVLANAISDDDVEPWFFVQATGKKDRLRKELIIRPGGMNALIRDSMILNEKGENVGIALIPLEQLAPWIGFAANVTLTSGMADDWPLSPYVRLMMHVAKVEGITDTNHSTTCQLAAALRQAAPDFGLSVGSSASDDLSPSMANDLAKAIRWPGARAGNGKGANRK